MSKYAEDRIVDVAGLSFRFPGGARDAVSEVSLAVAAGEFVVIAGPSGCGKSTLALAIGGYLFRPPYGEGQVTGSVRVAGMDVRRCPIYDAAEVVGLVQQNPEAQFCTLTVEDEVAFGLENRCLPPPEIRRRLDWALEVVGAGHLAGRLLATLSGGEKQKVAIAAVLAARPRVLILDEPTSNLDPTATAEILSVIGGIRQAAGLAVIVIEHKLAALRAFDPRLVQMEGGRVVSDGPLAATWAPPVRAATTLPHTPGANGVMPAVLAEGLAVGHGGPPVVQDVSLSIGPGEFVAVMGDNGSGKTTFLHSLLALLKPSCGRLAVLGYDTRRTAVSQLARHAGLIFQNPDHQLFAGSVWQEATFAAGNLGLLGEQTAARVSDLLARCGLAGRHGDHPFRLSYGEKRRLNLVSVLACEPAMILLDEVLIGQDPGNAAFLLRLLAEQVVRGATVILVNHDPEATASFATRLLFFEAGRIIVDGPPGAAFDELARRGYGAYVPAGGGVS